MISKIFSCSIGSYFLIFLPTVYLEELNTQKQTKSLIFYEGHGEHRLHSLGEHRLCSLGEHRLCSLGEHHLYSLGEHGLYLLPSVKLDDRTFASDEG